jgi:signal transduction histidine kinase/CheY-like chemotaxis protein
VTLEILKNKSDKDYILHNKVYAKFVVAIIFAVFVIITAFACFAFLQNKHNNQRILQKEAKNIKNVIVESFDYSNRINSYIGRQIAAHGAEDLNFILYLFREADKIINTNLTILSWTSFDWVNVKNLQTVNNRVGIRKNPPNMSDRRYTLHSKPWQLTVSPPTYGDPSRVWVIPAGTGIVDKKGRFLGTIVVGFDINELRRKIQKGLDNNDISFVVLDKDLNIITQSLDNHLKPDDNFYKQNKVNFKFDINSPGILRKEILVGDIRYSNYQTIDKYQYIILTGFNKELFRKGFINLIAPYILGFIIVTIFFLMMLYLFKIRIESLLDRGKKLTTSLYLANRSKISLIRATSHDLKNYIFGISGLAKLLLERKNIKHEDLELLKSIDEQSDELGYFVEDLLDTNQNETGIFALGRIEDCDIKELIQRMVLLNKSLAIKNRVEIVTDIADKMRKLRCDVRRMKQILNNIINNAIKYSFINTTVTVTAKQLRDKKQIYIEVKDEGIGMSEEEIAMALAGNGENIDKSELGKEIDSHGIGMPIVKSLVELHNGKLEIESAKKKGSKIKLYFNLFDMDLKEESPEEDLAGDEDIISARRVTIEGKMILLVDDNPVNAKIISVILQRVGCIIKHAKNGAEAIVKLDEENFDLILMDGEMPVMSGYEAAEKIRNGQCFKNFKNYENIPIIAVMGNSDSETIAKVKDCKMNAHLSKSSSAKEILDVVEEFLT